MIGGDDLVLEGLTELNDIDALLRLILVAWPNAVVEVAKEVDAEPFVLLVPFPAKHWPEIFIYRDAESQHRWKLEGWTEDHAGSVIFATVEEDAISFVFDDRASPTGLLVQEIIDALSARRWSLRQQEAA